MNIQEPTTEKELNTDADTFHTPKKTFLEKLRIVLTITGTILVAIGTAVDKYLWLFAVGATLLLAELGLYASIKRITEKNISRRKVFNIIFVMRIFLLLCFFLTLLPILCSYKELPDHIYWLCLISVAVFYLYALFEDMIRNIQNAMKKSRSNLIFTCIGQFLLSAIIVGLVGYYYSEYQTMYPEQLTIKAIQSPDRIRITSLDAIHNQEYSFKEIPVILDQKLITTFMKDLYGESVRQNWIQNIEYKRYKRFHPQQYLIDLIWKEDTINGSLVSFDGYTGIYFTGNRLILAPGEYDTPRGLIKLRAYYQLELSEETIAILSANLSKQ